MKGRLHIFILVLLTIVILGLVFWSGWRLRATLSSPIDRAPIDFEAFRRTGKPNDYLVCPPGLCGSAPDETSPVFDIPALQLKEEWLALVSGQPRTRSLSDPEGLQLEFEQRSWLLNFPDTITVRFYTLEENRSTLAIYRRSHYGYSDLSVNRRRVKAWLSELERRTRHVIDTVVLPD